MNIFSDIYGIVRENGLVEKIKHKEAIGPFVVTSFTTMLLLAFVYGFCLGFGAGVETAVRDAIKILLIFAISYFIVYLPAYVCYRLIGGEEDMVVLAAILMAGFLTTALVLATIAPLVLIYGILAGKLNGDFQLIQLTVITFAMILGFVMVSKLGRNVLTVDENKLALPMLAVIIFSGIGAVLLAIFFAPFYGLGEGFSQGWETLRSLWFGR